VRPIRVPANRTSFFLGVANGILWTAGSAFFDAGNVVAVFIKHLTRSSVLVGLIAALVPLGWQLPQLWEARYLEAVALKLRTYRVSAAIRITALTALTVSAWLLVGRDPHLALAAFMIFYVAYCLASGIGGVAFMDIVGKTVPGNYLGSFFGARQFGGGLLAATAGVFLVKPLLRQYGYPTGYLILFAAGTVIITIGLLCFANVPEPPGPAREAPRPLGEFLRGARAAFRRDRNLRRLLRLRLVMAAAQVGTPFYVLFCIDPLGAGDGMVGVYVAATTLGLMISNLVFAPLGDRRGHRSSIVAGSACAAVATVLAVSVPWLPVSHEAIAFAFLPVVFLLSAGNSGLSMGTSSYVIEHAAPADRPLYVGALNTLTAPVAFTPVLGGLIIQWVGYSWAFSLSAVGSVVALFLALRLGDIVRADPSPVSGPVGT
jgi:MFS family permease